VSEYPPFLDEMFDADPQFREAGRVNYEGFATRLGWRLNGQNMDPWSQVSPQEKIAWSAGAYDVLQKCWKQAAPQPRHRRQR
jgi:hypothetical protein